MQPYTQRYYKLYEKRITLPVCECQAKFMSLSQHQCIVLIGETGSGKITQIPKWWWEYSKVSMNKGIAVTQPNRVVAITAAQRVSEEMDIALGQLVGYCTHFEDCSSSRTVLKYMTDDLLLQKSMSDAMLDASSNIASSDTARRSS